MYLKNNSERVVVVINTVVGKIGIQPGEIIDLQCNLLPPVSENIIKVDEEEYLLFCKKSKKTDEVDKIQVNKVINESCLSNDSLDEQITQQKSEIETNTTEPVPENIIQEVTQTIQDPNTSDFIKNLFVFKEPQEEPTETQDTLDSIIDFEEKGQEPEENALQVKEMDSQSLINKLKQDVDKLKSIWSQTKNIRKKDKLSKQIKEMQKQIDKLEKEEQI